MMKYLFIAVLISTISLKAQSADNELVPVKQLIPSIVFDIRYSTTNNFTDQKLYTIDEAYLSLGAIKKLKLVQDSLKKITTYDGVAYPSGLGLKLFDGYRPRSVQYLMYEIVPNPVYVADPSSGSIHNRGGAVDVSIVDLSTGEEIPMPTEFDFFGIEASHSYNNLPPNIIANRSLLYNMMTGVAQFVSYGSEWWHYHYSPSSGFPLLDFQMK